MVAGAKAGGGALLLVLIPEVAALPDAMAQAGDGADGVFNFYHNVLMILFIEVTIHDIQYLKSDFGLFGIKLQFIANLVTRMNQITILSNWMR